MKVVSLALLVIRAKYLPGSRIVVRAIIAAGAVAATFGGLPAARAQGTTEPQFDSIYLLPAHGVRLPAANESVEDVIPSRATDRNRALSFSLAGSSPLSRASLIEMPGEVIPGRYTRPKYALGFRSNTMKSLAKDMGLDADTCLLPLVRARVSFSQDEGAGGRVMVFARCTFH